jgi:hypothetical protein
MLVGKWFPTGSHKVGASYGPLVERMVTGHFDPTTQKALWPSTGNYCRGERASERPWKEKAFFFPAHTKKSLTS